MNLSANTGCKLVEEFLYVVAKHFCEDLIRDTCSNIYDKSCLNESNNKKKLENNKIKISNNKSHSHYLTKVNVLDVFDTICKNDKYDFLTNNYMATTNSDNKSQNFSLFDKKNVENNSNYDVSQSKIK